MEEEAGHFEPNTVVIGASSGNWATQVGLLAPIFDFGEFRAVIDCNSVPKGKQEHLEASGVKIIPVPNGAVATEYVYELAQRHRYLLIDQYVHRGSVSGHKWTMDHIIRQMKCLVADRRFPSSVPLPEHVPALRAAKEYLQPEFPDMKIWGVASMSRLEKVPGSRSPEAINELKCIGGSFDYEHTIDGELISCITREDAYALNAELVRQHFITTGPTGALLLAGIWERIRDHWHRYESFETLMNNAGIVLGVIFIVDMHLPYLDDEGYRRYFV